MDVNLLFIKMMLGKSHEQQFVILDPHLCVCKADLMFSCERQRNTTYSTDYSSGSDADSEPYNRKVNHMPRRKKKKKKPANKKLAIVDLSDTEVHDVKQYNILDLITGNKYRSKPAIKKENITRNSNENKAVNNYNYHHILDMHTKLHSLKKKIWLGIGDTNARAPLWGSVPLKTDGRISTKKNEKTTKAATKKLQKQKEEIKEKPAKKTKDSFKRQAAIEIAPIKTTAKLRKSKSLMDTTKKDSIKYNRTNNIKLNFDKFQEGVEIVSGKNKSKKKPKTAKTSNRIS